MGLPVWCACVVCLCVGVPLARRAGEVGARGARGGVAASYVFIQRESFLEEKDV